MQSQTVQLEDKEKYCLRESSMSIVPVPSSPTYMDDVQLGSGSETINDESDFCYGVKNNELQVFGQSKLNDLVRDLGLAKEST